MNLTAKKITALITGAPDATTDYPFALNSMSVQKKDATNSYYSISMTLSEELMDAFTARPNGVIQLFADGVLFEYFNRDYLSFATGANSSSIVVSGYRQDTNASPVSVTIPLSAVSRERLDTLGRMVLTVVPDRLVIHPNDTAIWRGVSYTVLTISTNRGRSSVVDVTLEPV